VGIIKELAGFLAVGKGDAVGPAKNMKLKVVFFKKQRYVKALSYPLI
jgi:hypothetical protein